MTLGQLIGILQQISKDGGQDLPVWVRFAANSEDYPLSSVAVLQPIEGHAHYADRPLRLTIG